MKLVRKCLCGKTVDFEFKFTKIHGLSILKCPSCSVLHQKVNMTLEDYKNFYTTKYHKEHQQKLGQVRYDCRYDHDREIAEQRLVKYDDYLVGTRLLDIGASNGAFVDVAREYGMDAWGLELSEDILKHEHTYVGTLTDQRFEGQEFDNITMHDVLEHLVDPVMELEEVHRVLGVDGLVVIDIPDYYDPSGTHHWRPIEHLWFFDETQCCNLLDRTGFRVIAVDKPIPSKLVFYAEKKS